MACNNNYCNYNTNVVIRVIVIISITSEGRSFSLSLDRLKKDKGYGQPLNLMIGTGNVASIVGIFPFHHALAVTR